MTQESWTLEPTLPGRAYVSDEVLRDEVERIFFSSWTCVGRAEEAPDQGDYLVRELGGESLILVRSGPGEFRSFFNVCRHRGSRLLDADGHASKVIKCPYHAWTYRATDGALVGTPNVGRDERHTMGDRPLVPVRADVWEGFVFVNVNDDAPPLMDWLANDEEEPLQFERFELGTLRTGRWSSYPEVRANWKIIVENYHECLHCPTVHPELVGLIPTYRTGSVVDDPSSWGVPLAPGATSLTRSGRSGLPRLPGIDEEDVTQYFGCYVFPNLFLDFSSDCVTWDTFVPQSPGVTSMRGGYLFHPDTIAGAGFDPSDVVEFGELVTQQDLAICERAQRGVGSRAYAGGGVYPFQDRYVHAFNERYRRRIAGPAASPGRAPARVVASGDR